MCKKIILLLWLVLMAFSCASIHNSDYTKIRIKAPKNTTISFNNNSYKFSDDPIIIYTKRSKDSIIINLKKDSINTSYSLKSKNDFMYYLNILSSFGIGMLIDKNNQKRYTYKKFIAFKLDSAKKEFNQVKFQEKKVQKGKLFLFTSPLSAIDVFSQPMLTIGAEYFVYDNWRLSFEMGHTFFNPRDRDNIEVTTYKGNLVRLEIKKYNIISSFLVEDTNQYLGLEARFIRRQFNDDISYLITDNDISFNVDENFAVRRNLNIFNIKYGVIKNIGKHFYIDLYFGLGGRFAKVSNPNINFNSDIHELINDDESLFFFNLGKPRRLFYRCPIQFINGV